MRTAPRQLVKARTVRLSLCACGFPVLADHIGLGTVYMVDPEDTEKVKFICGGCHRVHHDVVAVYAANRDDATHGGYLPKEIFEIIKPETAFSA